MSNKTICDVGNKLQSIYYNIPDYDCFYFPKEIPLD